jgi:hypothetical protein
MLDQVLMTVLSDTIRMASCGMLRRVALVRTDVSEELNASIIKVTRIGCWLWLTLFLVHRFLSP